jgi:antitoxin ParD1/3/4
MPTRNVVLTDHQATLIEKLVQSGQYQNASEVLREGLRLLERRDAEDEAKLTELRRAIQVGIADVEAGRYRSFKTEKALREHLTALTREALNRRSE